MAHKFQQGEFVITPLGRVCVVTMPEHLILAGSYTELWDLEADCGYSHKCSQLRPVPISDAVKFIKGCRMVWVYDDSEECYCGECDDLPEDEADCKITKCSEQEMEESLVEYISDAGYQICGIHIKEDFQLYDPIHEDAEEIKYLHQIQRIALAVYGDNSVGEIDTSKLMVYLPNYN